MLALLFAMIVPAFAQSDDDDIATIVVQDTLSVAAAHEALAHTLSEQGYYRQVQADGDIIFRNAQPWRPVVVVTPQGHVRVRRRGVVLTPPGKDWQPGRKAGSLLGCLTPWTLVSCVSARGLVADHRKMQGQKTEVVAAMHEQVVELQDALSAEHLNERVTRDLSQIWSEGVDLDGSELVTVAERRAAIGRFWASRAPTVWGRAAQDLIARFAEISVQSSSEPFTASEIAQIESNEASGRAFISAPDPVVRDDLLSE